MAVLLAVFKDRQLGYYSGIARSTMDKLVLRNRITVNANIFDSRFRNGEHCEFLDDNLRTGWLLLWHPVGVKK
jgi:hypothetical protein